MRPVSRHRHFWPITIAITTIAVTMGSFPAYASWAQQFHDRPAQATTASGGVIDESKPHTHNDPATKNAISRAPQSADTADPTTLTQAVNHLSGVTAQRDEPDPTLVPTASPAARSAVPQDRYAMAGGCYALQSATTGKWVVHDGGGYGAEGTSLTGALPFHFQATDLGTYLLFGPDKTFLGASTLARPNPHLNPSTMSDWTVTKSGSTFTFTLPAKKISLGRSSTGVLVNGAAAPFNLRLTSGCAAWPEVDVNVTGNPFGGTTPYQEVRGYLDAHTHGMAFEFLGGDVHCGRPWHP